MRCRTALLLLPVATGACSSSTFEPPLPTLPTPAAELLVPWRPTKPPPPEVLPLSPPTEKPDRATVAAVKEGLVLPRRDWFRGVAYEPPYHPNHSYLVYTAEGRVTKFEMRPGEQPNGTMASVCSDGGVILSTAWTSKGAGPSRVWTLHLKAKMTAPRQDCDISTDRGSYHAVIQTTAHTHHQLVRWSDPYEFLSEGDPETPELCAGLDRAYTLSGDVGAFGLTAAAISNDGAHTCIRFPPNAGYNLPAVWLIEGDQERPASPSLIDGAYLIDGVPRILELRTDNATLRLERART